MKHVIIVNGPPRAGKDTAISIMRNLIPVPSLEFSSIEPVRQMLSRHVDLTRKTEADRKLLAAVGDALEEHSGFRTSACIEEASLFFAHRGNGVFFCHIREPRHISSLKRVWKLQRIKVTTVLIESIRAEKVTSNPADAGVLNMIYDYKLRNDGDLCQLRDTVRQFLVDVGLVSPLT